MKGLSVKKIIICAILAVVVLLVAVFAVRKISYGAIMGEAKDVSDYEEFELDDVEKIVTARIIYESYEESIQYFYNEDDVCLAWIQIDEDGYCYGAAMYDEYGNLIVEGSVGNSYGGFGVMNIYEYEYDDDDNMTRKKCYGSDGEPWWYVDYKYDKEGNVTKSIVRSGELEDIIKPSVTKYINKYDDGELVEVKEKGDSHIRELEYDDDGNIVSDVYLCEEGCFNDYIVSYEYDNNGNMLKEEEQLFDNSGNVRSNPITTYTYDNKGNLISKNVITQRNGEDIERVYLYSAEYVGEDVIVSFKEVEAYGDSTRYVAVVEFD